MRGARSDWKTACANSWAKLAIRWQGETWMLRAESGRIFVRAGGESGEENLGLTGLGWMPLEAWPDVEKLPLRELADRAMDWRPVYSQKLRKTVDRIVQQAGLADPDALPVLPVLVPRVVVHVGGGIWISFHGRLPTHAA